MPYSAIDSGVFGTRPVYIMPFNLIGVTAYHVLSRAGAHIAGFCDNDSALHGKQYKNTPVVLPQTAYSAHPDALIIITSTTYFKTIARQMTDIGFLDTVAVDPVLDMDPGFNALDDMNTDAVLLLSPALKSQLAVPKWFLRESRLPANAREEDAVVIQTVDICITQRCTLKCRDCSNLMQYYRRPRDLDVDRVLISLDRLLSAVDYIRNITIIGGEPLMHRQLPAFLDGMRARMDLGKIGQAVVITNGTLIPSREVFRSLKNNGVSLQVSNYGERSPKLRQIIDESARHDVECDALLYDWMDCCKIIDGNPADNDTVQDRYRQCFMSCRSLHNGALYYCPFLSHAHNLRAIPEDPRDYVDLGAPYLSRDTIREYMKRDAAYPGCRYCSGGFSHDAAIVEKAVQIGQPIEFKVF